MMTSHPLRRVAALLLPPLIALGCGSLDAAPAPPEPETSPRPDTPKPGAPDAPETSADRESVVASTCEPLPCHRYCGTGDDGCGSQISCGPCGEADHLLVSHPVLDLVRGQTRTLNVWITDDRGKVFLEPDLVWSVRDPEIASVSQSGAIFGAFVGSTIVSVRFGGLEGASLVRVIHAPEDVEFRMQRGCTDPGDVNC